MKHLIRLGVLVIFLTQNFYASSQRSQASHDYDLRPLFELDQISKGEAYPWISDDGLRIYYTAYDQDNKVFGIWYSERNALEHSFNNHKFLGINSSDTDNISSWLSADENTIAYVKRTDANERLSEVYISKRASHDEDFVTEHKVNITGGIKGTLISPSFTQDMEQMMVYNEYRSKGYLLIFKRESEFNFSYYANLEFPKGYRVKTGKLSNDGLEYYISLEKRNSKPCVYVMKRSDLDSGFESIQKFESDIINDPGHRNHQIYFSNNKDFAVFTRSFENEWDSNGIFIAKNKSYSAPEPMPESNPEIDILQDILVYPNPSIDHIYFKNIEHKAIRVEMYDAAGQLVKILDDLKNDTSVNISDLTPGSYYIKLIDENAREFRIVKHIKL